MPVGIVLAEESLTIDVKMLVKLLGMLGSSYDGEVANAGRMASIMLRDANMTWHDVINVPFDKKSYQRNYMRSYMRERRKQQKSSP